VIKFLARLPKESILGLGILTTLLALSAATVAALLCYSAFPDQWGWIMTAHMAAILTAAYFIPRTFASAFQRKLEIERVEAALERILGAFEARRG
jgi:hypothetical protein